MHSNDLPVTEWWDPEWDVYDVPNSPYDDKPAGYEGSEAEFDLWWTCYEHVWMLGWIVYGDAPYVPFKFGHQLTTGHGVPTTQCTCAWDTEDTGTGFYATIIDRDPDCPYHWAETYVIPCRCLYGLWRVDGAPGPWTVYRPTGIRRGELRTWAFKIARSCPHHGDQRIAATMGHALGHLLAEHVLDENERHGE